MSKSRLLLSPVPTPNQRNAIVQSMFSATYPFHSNGAHTGIGEDPTSVLRSVGRKTHYREMIGSYSLFAM